MKIENENLAVLPSLDLVSWKKVLRVFTLNVLAWLAFSAIGALTSLNDDLRSGQHPDYWEVLKEWGRSAIALALLSLVVYAGFFRWPQALSSARKIVISYGVLLLFLLPLQLIFVIQLFLNGSNTGVSWDAIKTPAIFCLVLADKNLTCKYGLVIPCILLRAKQAVTRVPVWVYAIRATAPDVWCFRVFTDQRSQQSFSGRFTVTFQ